MKMTKEKRKKIFKRFLKFTGYSCLGVILLGGAGAGFIYYNIKDDVSLYISKGYDKISTIDENTFNSKHPTQILDSDGNLIKEFKILNYDYQTYENINPDVFQALVAVEDVRFYEHKGIDLKGLLRGVYSTIVKGEVQGGSTITQQLAKNIFLTMDKTVWRKLEEAVIAQELEKLYSKEEILEFYVNNVNYGNGAYSIESASKLYFNRETEELNLAEIAFLIGIPNNPSLYNPLTNMENALSRKDLILNRMFTAGMITEEEMLKEQEREIVLDYQKSPLDNSLGNNYALNYAVQKATETLMKYDGFQFRYEFSTDEEREAYFDLYNESYAENRQELVEGGYIIETSIDMEMQDKLQSIVNSYLSGYTSVNEETGIYTKQASATMVDNETGNVIAIVGGRGEEENTYNRAVLGARQPGSTIKPLVSYTPAFEMGYVPDEKMEDKEIKNGPKNWYSGYKGFVTLRYATEISINTIPYRLTSEIGADKAIQYLANMKFKYLTPTDSEHPIISVGGFERGATTSEMASAYSTLARNGEFIEPTNIEKITKIGTEEVIYENQHQKVKIYEAGASYLMVDTLKSVMSNGSGTGNKIRNYTYQAGKTGTTDDNKDFWFCGMTPYVSMSVWIGDDTPTAQPNSLSKTPGLIWRDFMEYYHEGKESIDFEKPDTVYTDNNGVLRTELSNENSLINERKEKEEERKLAEIKEQNQRLSDEEYRIVYGLSEEEETAREVLAEANLNKLKKYSFNSLEQQTELNELLSETKNSIEDVKRKSAYNSLIKVYNEQRLNFENKLLQLKEEEQQKLEQERLEQERLEQEKLEKERLEKERLEQERLEQERLEQERLEQERLEQEKLEQEQLEQNSSNNNNNANGNSGDTGTNSSTGETTTPNTEAIVNE